MDLKLDYLDGMKTSAKVRSNLAAKTLALFSNVFDHNLLGFSSKQVFYLTNYILNNYLRKILRTNQS